VDQEACGELNADERTQFPRCHSLPGYNTVDVGNYAAQLAWWLAFFPADRFLILASQELREPSGRKRVRALCFALTVLCTHCAVHCAREWHVVGCQADLGLTYILLCTRYLFPAAILLDTRSR
jgi:hypothetical protein